MFAGWAMDPYLFSGLSLSGYDLIAIWDYNDSKPVIDGIDNYQEICIIAWSYGVFMASRFICNNRSLPITATIAVAGTEKPIDNTFGIPTNLFESTLKGLDENTLVKFYRRMCGGNNAYKDFCSNHTIHRSVCSARSELEEIYRLSKAEPAAHHDGWIGLICTRDLVFPPENQRRGMADWITVFEKDYPHIPDFQHILDNMIVKKDAIKSSFSRAATTYNKNATVQASVARELAQMLANIATHTDNILEIGTGSGLLTKELATLYPSSALTLVDITDIENSLPGEHVKADGEVWIKTQKDNSYSAVTAASTIQWFNSPDGFLNEALRVIAPGGIVAVSVYGIRTFEEIKGLKHPSRLFTKDGLIKCVPKQAKNVIIKENISQLHFDSPKDLLRHFRLTGVAPRGSGRDAVGVARRIIRDNIMDLTYNPLFLVFSK